MKFTKTRSTYYIEIDEAKFLRLLDSESYATNYAAFKAGSRTLGQKLDALPGIWNVDYNGHFGSAIHLSIDSGDDNAKTRRLINQVIDEHLEWCAGLDLVDHVANQRQQEVSR